MTVVCRNSQCCLVSDWLSGLQEDHVVLYQMAVWSAGRSCCLVQDWLFGLQEDHVV